MKTKNIGTTAAAKIIGVNASRVRQLLIAGELKGVKLGRDWFVSEKDAKAFVRNPVGRKKK